MHDGRLQVAVNAVPLAPGGGMVSLLGILQGWRKIEAPLDPVVFASRPPVMEAVQRHCPGVPVEPFAEGLGSMGHFIAQQTRFGPLLASRGFDVVLSNSTIVGRCKLPQVVHHRNLLRFQYRSAFGHLLRGKPIRTVRDIASRHALRRATVNAFISDFMRREAERVCPSSASRNRVVHNGVAFALVDKAEQLPSQPPPDTRELVAIQGNAAHKDNPTLIRCLAEVVRQRPDEPWSLTIAGEGDMKPVHDLAAELGVGDRVRTPGYLSHDALDPLLRNALCLVFTSVVEGFGNPPLEAMACGCPVVATNCTAIPEVVGDAGLLAPPGDHRAFAEAVLRLRDDPDLRVRLIRRGVDQIHKFRWEHSAGLLSDLLHEAARSRERAQDPESCH